MTFDDLRSAALAWPGVSAATSYGTPALALRGKILARLKEDGDTLVIKGVESDERDLLIAADPAVFFTTDHYRDWPIVLARLSAATADRIEPLLRRQCSAIAPRPAKRRGRALRR